MMFGVLTQSPSPLWGGFGVGVWWRFKNGSGNNLMVRSDPHP